MFKKKKKYIIDFLIILIFVLICVIFLYTETDEYIIKKDITNRYFSNDVGLVNEFISDRGFGSDRFDIYSFKLNSDLNLSNFKTIDKDYKKIIKKFINMMDIERKDPDNDEFVSDNIKKDLSEIENLKGSVYLYSKIEENKEYLYVYSAQLNKGYCFVFFI